MASAYYFGEVNASMQAEGKGYIIFENLMFYIGMFRTNCFNGKGLLVHENKDYYIGDWVDNKAEGRGSFYHYKGMVYTG